MAELVLVVDFHLGDGSVFQVVLVVVVGRQQLSLELPH
jgi:hypothetical protein